MAGQLMRSGGILSEATRTFLLQTEVGEDGNVSGMLREMSHERAVFFMGIDRAILMIDALMDEECPKSEALTMRTFKTGRHARSVVCDCDQQPLAGRTRRSDARCRESFLIRVICRQHNSCQGEVCWKGQHLCFRSALELMWLIYSVLDSGVGISEAVDESDENAMSCAV